MADKMFGFGGRAQQLQDIKWLQDDQFKSRVFNFNHDVSPGDFPSETFGVNRWLPLKNEVYQGEGSYGKKRGLVINHASIVAANQILPDTFYASADAETGIGVSGEMTISKDVLGNPITVKSGDTFRAYGVGCNSLLTVANGGADITDKYSSLDVAHGRYGSDGNLVAAGGNAPARAKNIPIGIAHNTIWRDDVGEVLNYSTKVELLDSIQSDYFVKVPCLIVDRANGILSGGPANSAAMKALADAGFDYDAANAYMALAKWTSFAYMNVLDLQYGALMKSDANGMFVPQEATPADAVTTGKTVQTVGKMFSLDSKWPKENQEMFLTFSDTKVTGSDTFGIPADLFIFALEYVKAAGVAAADQLTKVRELISLAAVGHLKINLHVS